MKNQIKILAGQLFSQLMPKRTVLIKENFSKLYWEGHGKIPIHEKFAERYIRIYLANKDVNTQGGSELEKIHQAFWEEKMGVDWYKGTAERFKEDVLPCLQQTLEALDHFTENKNIKNICEIGTGDGEMLAYLANRLNIGSSIGIDLSKEQIEETAKSHPSYSFHAGDASEWIFESSTDHTLFLTNHGVFEYFSEPSLQKLFSFIKKERPNSLLVMISEPIAEVHDLEQQKKSTLTTAGEFSFSHNYPHLVSEAGMAIEYQRENHDLGFRSMTLMASSNA